MSKTDDEKEFKLTPEQKAIADQLSEAEIEEIDQALLDHTSPEWSKAGRIVLTSMIELDNKVGIPGIYYWRMAGLVKKGLLESRGDLSDMRSSEVRLAGEKAEGDR